VAGVHLAKVKSCTAVSCIHNSDHDAYLLFKKTGKKYSMEKYECILPAINLTNAFVCKEAKHE
jgi:hypothetical protein